MTPLRTMTIVGTRPEIIRLSCLIPKLDEFTNHTFVHTGQNDDPRLKDVFFEDLELREPDFYLSVDTSSMGTVIGETIIRVERLLRSEKPQAVLILGDTNSAYSAIPAERLGIPVYHMEAGNRSFDNNVPEEINRRLIDHLSSFNLPYNDYSRGNLLSEGLHPRFIMKTGSPLGEVLSRFDKKISASKVLRELSLDAGEYFIASIHRQENVDFPERLAQIVNSLKMVSSHFNKPVLLSTHPRTKLQIDKLKIDTTGIRIEEPFGFLDYVQLQRSSFCVLSDSGTIAEESSILGFRAVSVRNSIERPEALDSGSITLSGLEFESLRVLIEMAITLPGPGDLPQGYEVADFSNRVLKFVLSTAMQHKTWKGLYP